MNTREMVARSLREAFLAGLECCEEGTEGCDYDPEANADDLLALTEQQEPVGWAVLSKHGEILAMRVDKPVLLAGSTHGIRPVYIAPPADRDREAMVRITNECPEDPGQPCERIFNRDMALGEAEAREKSLINLATCYRSALERFEPWMVEPCRKIAEKYQREAHFGPPCDQGTKLAFYEQWKKIAAAIQAATEALEGDDE